MRQARHPQALLSRSGQARIGAADPLRDLTIEAVSYFLIAAVSPFFEQLARVPPERTLVGFALFSVSRRFRLYDQAFLERFRLGTAARIAALTWLECHVLFSRLTC
ncbi:hypothetical protein G3A56_00010 [Rhizobium oryzihabitans]|uniref:Uncharacterized protein n=1 Tax=Rhizobium oryzihabitans TaxID=2267833 RepID=A0A7L5BCQ0_9HYPH|nr:hypothetical protein [Rhizobium oryzihabitans]QIB36586.1 hypothetical protein G3A56_00010 [Rhizobium oryzihabitans]